MGLFDFLLSGLIWALILYVISWVSSIFLTYNRTRSKWNASGKVVVITGVSSGIGKELTKVYAEQGARLAICARREDELKEVAELAQSLGAKDVLAIPTDVSVPEQCKHFIEVIGRRFGVIDCLILNAGISMGCTAEEACQKPELYRQIMDVNFFGSIDCTLAAIPLLRNSERSKIVVISSVIGILAFPLRTGYAASKWALHGFFESLRLELGPKYGTEITMICPGPVQTNINRTRLAPQPGAVRSLDLSSGMPADQAAHRIANAVAKGQRMDIFFGAFAYPLRNMFPDIIDRLCAYFITAKSK